jgi:hypothetical protein
MGQTNVSGSINGTQTWTTSGSPYRIQSNIYVNGSLIIQPGVEVYVEGPYRIRVTGSLQAIGTAQQPILFAADDTTGFHLSNTQLGGWHGLSFDYYTVPNANDISEIKHCIIRDVKLAYLAPNQSAAIYSQRGMEVKNCEFYHNWCSGGDGAIVRIFTTANQRNAFVKDSYFHDNTTWMACIRMNYNNAGMGHVQDCIFENNEGGVAIWAYGFPDIKIERNEIDNNASIRSYGMINTQDCSGRIGDNRVTHNDLFEQGAIYCINGVLLIEKNLICNNNSYADPLLCGITEGGGGLHLHGTSAQPESLKKHTVRDNIIANNSSGTWGGGMYVNDIDVWVHNNTILYNSSYYFGPSIYNSGSRYTYIHNNLFTGNLSTFTSGGTSNHVYVGQTVHVAYDYNFDFHDFSNSLAYAGSNFIGDSTHCISGVPAEMVNPTVSALVTQDATNKDFRLLQTSPCVNAGTIDTMILNSLVDSFDFGYEIRVVGDTIDIGAHEFPGCKDTLVVDSYTTCSAFTWIDGITYFGDNNTATVTFDRLDNCGDSIVQLNLTIHQVQAQITVANRLLSATAQPGAQYQWLNCDNNMSPIIGATGQTYLAPNSGGNFALVVTFQGCSDTTNCVELSSVLGTDKLDLEEISVYPNPTAGHVTVVGNKLINKLIIYDLSGKTVIDKQFNPSLSQTLDLEIPSGIYLLEVNYSDASKTITKLVIDK